MNSGPKTFIEHYSLNTSKNNFFFSSFSHISLFVFDYLSRIVFETFEAKSNYSKSDGFKLQFSLLFA